MGISGRTSVFREELLSPSSLLTAQGREKTLHGHFIREVISTHLHKATEEQVHSTVTCPQFESFINKKDSTVSSSYYKEHVYRWMWW